MLVVENLVKRYGRFKAVDGLSFSIEKGHIYGFVGANGAGKTTTMKIIAGLLKATSGAVSVDGTDISTDPGGVKKKIGYMPDFFGVYDDLKVGEYMDFYAGVYGIPKKLRAGISDELIQLVNLSDKKNSYVDSLSRGMKQRLCLARSLIHDPSFLILDEPASGLDPMARIEMKEVLKELRSMGKTILISSHILPELAEICTSIGIIDHGKMVVSGTVDDIMKKAASKKTIKIKVLGESGPVMRFLEEQPDLEGLFDTGDGIEAGYNGDDSGLSELLARLVKNDIPVISYTEMEKNLESVFMNLVSGTLQAGISDNGVYNAKDGNYREGAENNAVESGY